ncbi:MULTISPECIES: cation-transporting P-type ATPase [Methylophaga]|uniref:cation-transporting P-type ATPase n=1 Tax=Methylophaga TaxID=40222 RepID=UPI00235388F9|nr:MULTISPECIES: cation-transporting P-type ATPase [Methylophaga]
MNTSKKSVSAWHTLSVESLFETVNSSATGLKQQEAEERLKRYGKNSLPKAKKRSAFIRFLSHFHNILIYVLLGSAVITAALAHWIDTAVILAVVMANAIISFIQEGKAESAMGADSTDAGTHCSCHTRC